VKNGIDKQLIEASVNISEFNLREVETGPYPKGFGYSRKVLRAWLHDKNPIDSLKYEELLDDVKLSLTTDLFERLIDKWILQNNHYCLVTMEPEPGLIEAKEEKLRVDLANKKKLMSETELKGYVALKKRLLTHQSAVDSEENLKKIPTLKIEDINPIAENISFNQSVFHNVKCFEHDIFTNGIAYIRLYFETPGLEAKFIPYTKILKELLSVIDTKNHSYSELTNLINIHTGGFDFDYTSIIDKDNDDKYRQFLTIKMKALFTKTKNLAELLSEITLNTIFDDKARIKEILNEIKSYLEMYLVQAGHMYVINKIHESVSESGKFDEKVSGVEFYTFISELIENYDDRFEETKQILVALFHQIFNKNNLYISITSPLKDIEYIKESLVGWIESLPIEEAVTTKLEFPAKAKKIAYIIPSMVQFVGKGYSFKKLNYEYSGSMEVLKTILGLDYLWNRVRVQGGAYGAFVYITRGGLFVFCSYRDPHLNKTLEVYDECSGYLADLKLNDFELTKYIIGTIRGYDQPQTASSKSSERDRLYFKNITQEDMQKVRDEVLKTNNSDLVSYSEMLKKIMKENCICVLGSGGMIEKDRDLFEEVISVTK
jgi:hypothetical protein